MKTTKHTLTALALALASTTVWGQTVPTVCTNVTKDGSTDAGTPTITIAVASNFYEPAQTIAKDFINYAAASTDTVIGVCHNASGVLVNQINDTDNPSPYSLFLAADDQFPGAITVATKGDEFTYAFGIPVLWSNQVSTDGLMSNGAINKTNVTSLAIADPLVAPYGKAAQYILEEILKQWETPGSWIIQHPNIAQTKDAIKANGGQVAGFVSKAQVCKQLGEGFGIKDDFAVSNLRQSGVQLDNGDTATTDAFVAYLVSAPVQSRLASNEFCYALSE